MEHVEGSSSLAQDVATETAAVAPTFEDLFAAQHERLYRALYLIVGNGPEAEELMQDAFLKVLERWDRIEDPTAYLYRCALNAARSRFRRLTMAAKRTITSGHQEDPFSLADLRDEVVRALRSIPERQRLALVLVDLLDYRSEEAAEVMRVTASTVRSLATQGRAALRLYLEVDDDR